MSMDLSTAKSHQKGCPNPAVGTSQIVRGGYNTNTIFLAPAEKAHFDAAFRIELCPMYYILAI